MKYEDLVKMSVKELKDRLKDLNTQAQAAAGKDLDALLEEATTITGILDDVKNREKLAGIAKDAEGGAEPTGGEKGEEVKDKAREERGQNIKDGKAVKFSAKKTFGVKNALSVSQTVTPTHSAADVKETFNDVSSLVDRVTSIPLNGGETYQRGYVKSYGDGAGGTAEGGDYNATEPVFGYVTIEKQKITAYTEEPEESADVYIQAFDGSTVPVTADICKPENLMAYISGGASVEYKPSFYTAKDDTGKKSKTIVTEEEVTLKTGIMTFDGNKFKYLCDTARVTEDKAKKRRTVKIGGIDNRQGARYVICLHHKDAVDGDIWVMIVGNNQAGFTISFEKDKETVVDEEITALPMDEEGTLLMYEEEMTESEAAAV